MNPDTTDRPVHPHRRLALFWAMWGALGTLAVFPYLLTINPVIVEQVPVPLPVLAIVQALQTGIILFLLGWLGLRSGEAIGLDSPLARTLVEQGKIPPILKAASIAAVITGIVGGIVIVALDALFAPFMPEPLQALPDVALWKGLLASFYGGITEELLMRLFLMTLIAWLLWQGTHRQPTPPSKRIFWVAIVTTAFLFGIGHLPVAAGIWGLTPIVILRTIVLNLPLGVAFGWFYWQWGLEYAMLAHFTADVVLRGVGGS